MHDAAEQQLMTSQKYGARLTCPGCGGGDSVSIETTTHVLLATTMKWLNVKTANVKLLPRHLHLG